MGRLIVVGNGFDMAHGLKSSYRDFGNFLKTSNPRLYRTLDHLLVANNDWADLEEALANANLGCLVKCLLEEFDLSNNISRFMNNRFDIFVARYVQSTLEDTISQLTSELKDELRDWVLELDSRPALPVFEGICQDDYIVSFNYTSTIERLYNIESSQILYIHNRATKSFDNFNFRWAVDQGGACFAEFINEEPQLVFGHGRSDCDRSLPSIPVDSMTYDYDLNIAYEFYVNAFEEAYRYYDLSRKQVKDQLPVLEDFLSVAGPISEVFIVGHSLANVDIDYFKLLMQTDGPLHYTIAYYGEGDRLQKVERCKEFVRSQDSIEFIDTSISNRLVFPN